MKSEARNLKITPHIITVIITGKAQAYSVYRLDGCSDAEGAREVVGGAVFKRKLRQVAEGLEVGVENASPWPLLRVRGVLKESKKGKAPLTDDQLTALNNLVRSPEFFPNACSDVQARAVGTGGAAKKKKLKKEREQEAAMDAGNAAAASRLAAMRKGGVRGNEKK